MLGTLYEDMGLVFATPKGTPWRLPTWSIAPSSRSSLGHASRISGSTNSGTPAPLSWTGRGWSPSTPRPRRHLRDAEHLHPRTPRGAGRGCQEDRGGAPVAGWHQVGIKRVGGRLALPLLHRFFLQIKAKTRSRRADSNRFPAHYE